MLESHIAFIDEAVRLAAEGLANGNPPFGAVLVLDGQIRAKAYNTIQTDSNFMLHGEINCLMKAREILSPGDFSRAVLYASSEPCPMCCGAIYWSGIRTVVFGSSRQALTRVRKFGLYIECREILGKATDTVEVIGPVCEEAVIPLYEKFYSQEK